MVAMKNATENAEELIEDLTLSYNKVRQANITREMIEIASGAERALTRQDAGGNQNHGDRRHRPRPAESSRSPDPVVDIEFPAGQLPAIYNAVEIQREGQEPLTCEVQQHLGNNWVRAVAMTTTDGLARGVDGPRHRRPDHGPGRRGDARSRLRRARSCRSTARAPVDAERPPADPPRPAGRSTSSRPRSRSSRPASRSST